MHLIARIHIAGYLADSNRHMCGLFSRTPRATCDIRNSCYFCGRFDTTRQIASFHTIAGE